MSNPDPQQSTPSLDELEQQLDHFNARFRALRTQVQRGIVGYEELITDCLVAMLSQGHVLLEGVPGLGKTSLVKTLSQVIGLSFGRVQCTPDLMPADILGTHIVGSDHHDALASGGAPSSTSGGRVLRFEKGPVFRHLLLVDEINRATPKTQSALLEVMQERTVTAGSERFSLPQPFFVLATQNPLEMEGTYPLPEAQLDRFFFKLHATFPNVDELVEITNRTTGFREQAVEAVIDGPELMQLQELLTAVPVAQPLVRYAATLILATHPDTDAAPKSVKRFVSYGASPRGLQAIIRAARAFCLLDGRTAVSIADIHRATLPALRHRVILNFEGQAEALNVDQLVKEVLEHTPTPSREKATA